MDRVTIDGILEKIQGQLHVSKESEYEVLEEIRTHLEDEVARSVNHGMDEQAALRKAAEGFGIEQTGAELQEIHANRESIDAIIATALPVLFAIGMRWLAFAPDGTALNWRHLLILPGFWIVAIIALLIPVIFFGRWRLALVGWGFFWLLTIIFVLFPSIHP